MQDRIWLNATILTMNPEQPAVDAVVSSGDRIVYAGTVEGARSFARSGAEEIDLGGAFMIPGFN